MTEESKNLKDNLDSIARQDKISAGSYDFNKWLFGGYEKSIITMIAGPAGSGKTNFCILASASQAKKGNKVIFVDTEGGFSIERIKQIVSSQEDLDKILNNILLLKPTNFIGEEKEALLIIFPKKFSIILVEQKLSSTATNMPFFSVPFLIIKVASIPRFGSRCASITKPEASVLLSAVKPSISAKIKIRESNSSTPVPIFAEMAANGTLPP